MNKPKYIIGVDCYDENNSAYCLTRNINGTIEVLLAKTMIDVSEFNQEVHNLAKYFDANVIKESDFLEK